jgi:Transglycosylase SLT domain
MADPPIDISTSDLGVGTGGQGNTDPNYIPNTYLTYDSGPVQKYSGGSGTSNQINVNILNIGGWKFQAYADGVYVTTPSGILTKLELIDTRYVPVPQPVALDNVNVRTRALLDAVPGGPQKSPGGQVGHGNATGGGGASGSGPNTPGSPFQADNTSKITPGGDGEGYKAISDAAKAKLPPSMNNPQFLGCLDSLAKSKNVPADSILTVMQIESGFTNTDQPGKGASAVNQLTQASGLNQIMPDTAKSLGYTTQQIQGMTAAEQMCGPTTAYFNHITLPEKPSTADLYLANFYPAAVGQPDNYVIGNHPGLTPQAIASANPIFVGPGGVVTNGSVKSWIASKYPPS